VDGVGLGWVKTWIGLGYNSGLSILWSAAWRYARMRYQAGPLVQRDHDPMRHL
jgi:hypothetical protein